MCPDGSETSTSTVQGTFNTPTLYEANYGTTSTTDLSTGVTTTNSFADVIDTSSDDAASNSTTAVTATTATPTTPTNADSGTLQQAWSMYSVTSQTDASGNPIGTVTSSTESGSDTETRLNGSVTDPGILESQATTTTAAGSTSPTSPLIPQPGDLLAGNWGSSNTPAPTDQQSSSQQGSSILQGAMNAQQTTQQNNENGAAVPGKAAGGISPAEARGAQLVIGAGFVAGGINGNNIANLATPQTNGASAGSSPPNAQQIAQQQMQRTIDLLQERYGTLTYVDTDSQSGTVLYRAPNGTLFFFSTIDGSLIKTLVPPPQQPAPAQIYNGPSISAWPSGLPMPPGANGSYAAWLKYEYLLAKHRGNTALQNQLAFEIVFGAVGPMALAKYARGGPGYLNLEPAPSSQYMGPGPFFQPATNYTLLNKLRDVDFQKKVAEINYVDCSDIASILFRTNNKQGQIIEFLPNVGELYVKENGITVGFKYHEVFVENGMVYDPRFSAKPVSLAEYIDMLNALNPSGFNTRVVEGL